MKSCPWNFTIPVKLEIYFLMLLWEIIVFGVFAENYSYLQPLKSVKKNAIWVELFWYKVFVRCKLKYITQFPDGFHLVPGCRSIIIKIMQNFQQFQYLVKEKSRIITWQIMQFLLRLPPTGSLLLLYFKQH